MSILESVVQGLGVEINKQFQVYDLEGNHVVAAVFKMDRSGCQLLVTPKSEAGLHQPGYRIRRPHQREPRPKDKGAGPLPVLRRPECFGAADAVH